MRFFAPMAFLALALTASAIPITPSARELQRRAEQFRLEGLRENEIEERLSDPSVETEPPLEPLFSRLSTKLHSVFHQCDEEEGDRDISGDIAPGSLEGPEILPRGGGLGSAYEGKELELRRPTGMRHWGAEDKWRLF